jgi:hypothetical protein
MQSWRHLKQNLIIADSGLQVRNFQITSRLPKVFQIRHQFDQERKSRSRIPSITAKMSQFGGIPLNPYPATDRQSYAKSHRQSRPQTGEWPQPRADEAPPPFSRVRRSVPGNQAPEEPGFEYYKPRKSYKRYFLIQFGVILLLILAIVGMGIYLHKHQSQMHNRLIGPANCTALDGTTGTNTTDLLSQDQIKSCFQVVYGVCEATYNATNPVPQRNSTVFQDQCDYVIWWLYCEFDNFCNAMAPFCSQEFLEPVPSGVGRA